MRSFLRAAALLSLALSPVTTAQEVAVLERDLAIIGGGSSGSFSAVVGKQDYGLSVVVIEKSSRLGGHVTFWTDPATGRTYECGVQNYLNITGAQKHFERLGVPIGTSPRATNAQRYIDFIDGQEVPFIAPETADRTAAFTKYVELTEQWRSRMEPGYHNFFNASKSEIPEDLTLPFGQFVEKYNLTAAIMQFYYLTGFSHETFMNKPTLGFVRSLPPDFINVFLGKMGALTPASGRNQDLYDASQRLIGDENILFDSTVESSTLPCNDTAGTATLMVRNAKTGQLTKIVAKRVLFAASPTNESLAPMALLPRIKSLFSKMWNFPSVAYVAVVSHPALPANTTLINTPAAAAPNNYELAMPDAPFMARFEQYYNATVYRAIVAGNTTAMTVDDAKAVIQGSLERMIAAGTIAHTGAPTEVTYHEIKTHGVTGTTPSAENIRCGYYDRLMEYNGQCGVWYTGANLGAALSTHIWQEAEVVLGKIKSSIDGV